MPCLFGLDSFEPYLCYSSVESLVGYLLTGTALLWCVEMSCIKQRMSGSSLAPRLCLLDILTEVDEGKYFEKVYSSCYNEWSAEMHTKRPPRQNSINSIYKTMS